MRMGRASSTGVAVGRHARRREANSRAEAATAGSLRSARRTTNCCTGREIGVACTDDTVGCRVRRGRSARGLQPDDDRRHMEATHAQASTIAAYTHSADARLERSTMPANGDLVACGLGGRAALAARRGRAIRGADRADRALPAGDRSRRARRVPIGPPVGRPGCRVGDVRRRRHGLPGGCLSRRVSGEQPRSAPACELRPVRCPDRFGPDPTLV